MNLQKIIECNKLIAQYLYPAYFEAAKSEEPMKVNPTLTDNCYWVFVVLMNEDYKNYKNLNYSTDWNCLVPVLKKIAADEGGLQGSEQLKARNAILFRNCGWDKERLYVEAVRYIQAKNSKVPDWSIAHTDSGIGKDGLLAKAYFDKSKSLFKIEVGTKVVPHAKTADGRVLGLKNSVSWNIAKAKKQPYLYAVKLPLEGDYQEYVLAEVNKGTRGDYFFEADFTIYIEPERMGAFVHSLGEHTFFHEPQKDSVLEKLLALKKIYISGSKAYDEDKNYLADIIAEEFNSDEYLHSFELETENGNRYKDLKFEVGYFDD